MKFKFLSLLFIIAISSSACSKNDDGNALDNLDPSSPATEEELRKFDEEYERITGMKAHIPAGVGTCRYTGCPVFALVNKETQTLDLYIDGNLEYTWAVSSGAGGFETPALNKNPNGRIYNAYTSKKFPGGDYEGLGNMPYAVFIEGGYAIHGTSRGNWKKLGTKASHGCIRIHPDNAKIFNGLVREHGVKNVWITIQ